MGVRDVRAEAKARHGSAVAMLSRWRWRQVLSPGMPAASGWRRGEAHSNLGLQNCRTITFCNNRNLILQHKTHVCSSKHQGTNLPAQKPDLP